MIQLNMVVLLFYLFLIIVDVVTSFFGEGLKRQEEINIYKLFYQHHNFYTGRTSAHIQRDKTLIIRQIF